MRFLLAVILLVAAATWANAAHAETPAEAMASCTTFKASVDGSYVPGTTPPVKQWTGTACTDLGATGTRTADHMGGSCHITGDPTGATKGLVCFTGKNYFDTQVTNRYWEYNLPVCTGGQQYFPGVGCKPPCNARPEETGWEYNPDVAGGSVCSDGCSYDGAVNMDGSTSHVPNGNTCTVGPDSPAPVPDTDHDGVGDPTDAFPNDPGETKDSDGDGIGDNADTKPNDPTNGADDGTGNETDNQSAGGGTCAQPPSCSGDAIQCNTLFQQWKTRCAAEGISATVSGSPEVCSASYTCTGNTAQCAQVALLRKEACKAAISGAPVGDGNADGVPDVLQAGDGYTPGDAHGLVTTEDGEGDMDGLDTNGWLSSTSCPQIPDVLGDTRLASIACEQGNLIRTFVMVLAFVFAAGIIGRAATGG